MSNINGLRPIDFVILSLIGHSELKRRWHPSWGCATPSPHFSHFWMFAPCVYISVHSSSNFYLFAPRFTFQLDLLSLLRYFYATLLEQRDFTFLIAPLCASTLFSYIEDTYCAIIILETKNGVL